MSGTNHTATPWVANKIEGKPSFNIRAGLESVAMVYEFIGSPTLNDRHGEGAANAAHIVRCVNSHDALVQALRKCLECACFSEEDTSEIAAQSMLALIGSYAQAALRAAEAP